MRGKRSKQYRKLMQQYELSFGFREPYQVLVDADIIKDAERFKMDLVGGLERTLHGKIKPMITQCSIRHLYALKSEPGMSAIIDKAKLFERRRCGHLPEEYPEPLSSAECISSVVDPKSSKTNKHRYVVASQQSSVRSAMREVLALPLIYINRSVMIMEPMAGGTVQNRESEEKGKFRAGIKSRKTSVDQDLKRKREEGDDGAKSRQADGGEGGTKRKKLYGRRPKGPNPLSIKKPKNREVGGVKLLSSSSKSQRTNDHNDSGGNEALQANIKRRRRRKHNASAAKADDDPLTDNDNSRILGD